MASEVVLKTIGLKKIYRSGPLEVPALRGVDVEVARGEFISIMGPSGCGKTTLLQLLGGLSTPTEGRILIDGVDLTHASDADRTRIRREKIGFVFQRFNLLPTLSVQGNIEIARNIYGGPAVSRGEIEELLDIVRLGHKLDYRPLELSVGEQQRVAIARALVNNPSIILADEPTGNLDSRNSDQVLRLLNDLNREKRQTIVMITHNPQAAHTGNRVIEMLDGRIIRDGSIAELVEAHEKASSAS